MCRERSDTLSVPYRYLIDTLSVVIGTLWYHSKLSFEKLGKLT